MILERNVELNGFEEVGGRTREQRQSICGATHVVAKVVVDALDVGVEALARVAGQGARSVGKRFSQKRVVGRAAVLVWPHVQVKAEHRRVRRLEGRQPVELFT